MEGAYTYDLIVIGGGSGGLAAAKEAKVSGAEKVALFDYVKPTIPHGTKWGLGGTCVNVGCVPKKLMHYAASMGPLLHHDASHFGWDIKDSTEHNWNKMINTVQNHIKKLNFGYKVGLRNKKVEYINALATITGPHEVSYTTKEGQTQTLSTRYILIAVGGRPYVPSHEEVPGAKEYCITSDDLFSWKKPPGKTLVVGASYIALECAGFLTELGYPTTVAVRSILLRGFDRQCSEKVGAMMEEMGTRFVHSLPSKISKMNDGKLLVDFAGVNVPSESFDTVLYATGRRPDTTRLGLEAVGVKMDPLGKIIATDEKSSVESIYVVGDAYHGRPELTPVAIATGELLARRLFANATAKMDWNLIPTTVFTPIEYGSCGFSEENAIEHFGKDNVEVFLFEFSTLETSAAHRPKAEIARLSEYDIEMSSDSLTKLVCIKNENMRVVGFHYVGPNAGETTQGYALALRLRATKADFDNTIGIHPTNAEAFHSMSITRSSGVSWVAAGGCGGGKCG